MILGALARVPGRHEAPNGPETVRFTPKSLNP